MPGYNQLTLSERKKIEEALNEGKSFRAIGALIGRNVSTVSREIKENRSARLGKVRRVACRDRNWCRRVSLCEKCYHKGAYCVGCSKIDCRDVCANYTEQARCDVLTRSPWVCNSCRKKRFGCNRENRFVYQADIADKIASERRSESRRGINTQGLDMDFIERILKDALKRKLSPYEIATLYADVCHVSSSTLYRWVEAGVGDACNLDLKRKVGFKPRKGERPKRSTRHTEKRNYGAFSALSEERQASATEMDCVEGFRRNSKVLLTLYHRPSHLQIAILLAEHTCKRVQEALKYLKSVCDKALFAQIFGTVLTDNGHEFEFEDELEEVFSGQRRKVHLFYCNPRQSQEKAGCEKAHTMIRELLPKGRVDFDELSPYDIAVVNSHANSSPRLSLCGLSPIDMFLAAYGDKGKEFLDALGIEKVSRDDLTLNITIINIERRRRGEDPLTEF